MAIQRFEELQVYQQAFAAASCIFRASRRWPKEERYALTDQIRRSSRSVCANMAEAWRKRRYAKHFISKLSDADAEAAETRVWLRFALECGYLNDEDFEKLNRTYDRICAGLVRMMQRPEQWCVPNGRIREIMPPYLIPPNSVNS